MFTGPEIVDVLKQLQITHVVWLPDSTLGQWERELRAEPSLEVITVCREGEAWHVAGGLYLGGANPLVMIQCTGLFESGDALRNTLHDYRLPLRAIVGYRSYLNQSTLPGDTCLKFTEPILDAWQLHYEFIDSPAMKPRIFEHLRECGERDTAGIALLAEGRA